MNNILKSHDCSVMLHINKQPIIIQVNGHEINQIKYYA